MIRQNAFWETIVRVLGIGKNCAAAHGNQSPKGRGHPSDPLTHREYEPPKGLVGNSQPRRGIQARKWPEDSASAQAWRWVSRLRHLLRRRFSGRSTGQTRPVAFS